MSRDYVIEKFKPEVHLQIDYARELNPQQLAAVTAPPGPALVIAGAGSGKTRTLTYRVAYLLEQGIPADRILLLTFTNKAAGEMMRRVADLLGRELRELWGGTFHSIGARILRLHADTLGYQRDFTILDRDDAKDLIKACVADAKIETKATHFPKPEVLNEIFSLAANTHKSVGQLMDEQYGYLLEKYTGESELDEVVSRLSQLYASASARRTRWISTTCSRSGSSCFRTTPTCASITSAGSNSSSWTNIRTRTSSRAI